ncbi:MAG: hypothetical protein K6F37_00210 [Lachnospiraceae bacterium]|nr:hypothetical protein [Lachnospiraceae bacterium]
MAILDTLQNAVGNVNKAILCIKDYNSITGTEADDVAGQNAFAAATSAISKAKESYKQATARMSSLQSLMGENNSFSTEGYIPLEVQYNPSSIKLNTTGKGSGGYLIGSNNVTQASQLISQTQMSFELIIENINNQDAFDMTSMGFNVETIYDLAKDLAGGPFSVINQVQGLLGLINNKATQDMIFMWGDMAFRGKLMDVNVEYTMFNKDGNPIYAKVGMTLQHIYDQNDKEDQKYWDNVIKKVFRKNEYMSSYR